MQLLERDVPLAEMHNALMRAHGGNGSTIIVSGEAGIGKSSLLRSFAGRAEKGTRVVWGGCDALSTPRPLGPMQDMAGALGGRLQDMIDRKESHSSLFTALLRTLEESNATEILLIEDLHWADTATLDLIRYLGRRIGFLRALLIISLRSDEVDPEHPLVRVLAELPASDTLRLPLAPLSESAVASLAAAAGQNLPQLHAVTHGNPFFVTELLQGRKEPGAGLPQSVRDAVWARLQRLDAQQRQMLNIMSVLPGGMEFWLLAPLFGEQASAVAEQCQRLGLLLVDSNGNYQFRHELARLATLERLPDAQLRQFHAQVLDAMLAQGGVPLSRLVHHAAGAGDSTRVVELAPRAAQEAAALGAHLQAAEQLATALQHAAKAPKEQLAQLHEDWSYEAGLSQAVGDKILAARQTAIALWRELGRRDKVGLNLRWLSRLHWYRGESAQATEYLNQAVAELEAIGPGPELAMAYSTRSQFHMLHDRMAEAVEWGKKAIAVAERFGAHETRAHALNNVGSALLFAGDDAGRGYLEESLALSLKHGFHEQAARAYTNYSEYAVITRQFPLAEQLLNDGIAFDMEHELESWTYYLVGRLAQLRLEQGRLAEAKAIALSVLAREGQTMLMKLPALTMLARASARMGEPESAAYLAQAVADSQAIGEQQYIGAAQLAQIESAWLAGDIPAARSVLQSMSALRLDGFDPWERGDLLVWWQRLKQEGDKPPAGGPVSRPRQLELEGLAIAAADEWLALGVPFEAALALLHDHQEPKLSATKAIGLLQEMGANAAVRAASARLAASGIVIKLRKPKRGPYRSARVNPMGLTAKEMQILELVADGRSNQQISKVLSRSQRTIEHHVSAILSKFSARTRLDLVLRVRQEPWLMAPLN